MKGEGVKLTPRGKTTLRKPSLIKVDIKFSKNCLENVILTNMKNFFLQKYSYLKNEKSQK